MIQNEKLLRKESAKKLDEIENKYNEQLIGKSCISNNLYLQIPVNNRMYTGLNPNRRLKSILGD